MRTCPRTIRVRGQSRTSVALFLDIQLRGVEEESNTGDADLSTDDPGEGTIKDQSKESTDNLGKGTIKDDAKESTDNGELTSPFSIPKGCMKKAKWLVSWPLLLLLFFTIPNCSRTRWEKYLIVVFLLISTVWIAVFSYLMVWMVTIIRYTFGIPDVIMDITVLAIGTSIPDFFTSLTAARQDLGDMAVANSIGSNVFDILVGLGLPWALKTIANGSVVMNTQGFVYSALLLLGSVALTTMTFS
ncbi:sodium/potassium/calcium exchanger 4-like isoform X3 [Tachysurus fulvidraco]|uniref:sodium/potassium/calcium exchanger 4-like isoform X3 n=1 Tax=Tachysurus fulvidraco TaxID=1234273 RepID=UPI001FEFF436|nr:sodium/potassium/calcium exchanger 4-like isoform X3 [Tachysurus fulvidraco]